MELVDRVFDNDEAMHDADILLVFPDWFDDFDLAEDNRCRDALREEPAGFVGLSKLIDEGLEIEVDGLPGIESIDWEGVALV